jgi:hypothetical protein
LFAGRTTGLCRTTANRYADSRNSQEENRTMFAKTGRLWTALSLAVIVTGLAVVILESWFASGIPYPARLALRTLFWVSAVLYFALRLSGGLKRPGVKPRGDSDR